MRGEEAGGGAGDMGETSDPLDSFLPNFDLGDQGANGGPSGLGKPLTLQVWSWEEEGEGFFNKTGHQLNSLRWHMAVVCSLLYAAALVGTI